MTVDAHEADSEARFGARRRDEPPAGRGGGGLAEEGHGPPRGQGGARAARDALPGLRTAVERIVHAQNATTARPHRQSGGKLLKDRALSQLLQTDRPRTIDELEERRC